MTRICNILTFRHVSYCGGFSVWGRPADRMWVLCPTPATTAIPIPTLFRHSCLHCTIALPTWLTELSSGIAAYLGRRHDLSPTVVSLPLGILGHLTRPWHHEPGSILPYRVIAMTLHSTHDSWGGEPAGLHPLRAGQTGALRSHWRSLPDRAQEAT